MLTMFLFTETRISSKFSNNYLFSPRYNFNTCLRHYRSDGAFLHHELPSFRIVQLKNERNNIIKLKVPPKKSTKLICWVDRSLSNSGTLRFFFWGNRSIYFKLPYIQAQYLYIDFIVYYENWLISTELNLQRRSAWSFPVNHDLKNIFP